MEPGNECLYSSNFLYDRVSARCAENVSFTLALLLLEMSLALCETFPVQYALDVDFHVTVDINRDMTVAIDGTGGWRLHCWTFDQIGCRPFFLRPIGGAYSAALHF